MASRKPDTGGASTATTEKKTRTRKSPKEKAESLTVRACNALDALGCMAGKLTEPQRDKIDVEIQKYLAEMNEAFKDATAADDPEEPEPFSLPD